MEYQSGGLGKGNVKIISDRQGAPTDFNVILLIFFARDPSRRRFRTLRPSHRVILERSEGSRWERSFKKRLARG